MLIKSLLSTLALTTLASTAVVTSFANPSQADNNKYFCARLGGVPHTFVRTARGNVAMIKWQSAGKWSAIDRCVSVSQRFQAFSDNGLLRNIATGVVNGQSVICAVVNKGDSCNNSNLLVTLTGSNRYDAARQLLDTRNLAKGNPVLIRGKKDKLETFANNEYYFDPSVIEKIAPVVTEEVTPIDSK